MEAIDNHELAKKGEHIGKLQDIVMELSNSLDFEVGGEVSQELASLYDFILHASTQANIKIDKTPLIGCLNVLNTLYAAWVEAIKTLTPEDKAKLQKKYAE